MVASVCAAAVQAFFLCGLAGDAQARGGVGLEPGHADVAAAFLADAVVGAGEALEGLLHLADAGHAAAAHGHAQPVLGELGREVGVVGAVLQNGDAGVQLSVDGVQALHEMGPDFPDLVLGHGASRWMDFDVAST
jgi:hypothetical protein